MSHTDLHAKTEVLASSGQSSSSVKATTKSSAGNAISSGAKKSGSSIFRYPYKPYTEDEKQNGRDYLRIQIKELEYGGFNSDQSAQKLLNPPSQSKSKQSLKATIYLPMPQNLQDSNSLGWGDDRIGPLGAAAYSLGKGVISGEIQNTYEALENAVKGLTKDDSARSALLSYVTGMASGGIGGNISPQSVVTRATGQILQTNLELLFQGVSLRTFSFPFNFAPRSREEAEEVKKIIRVFKKHMSAKKSGQENLFIKSPDVFQLTFMKGTQQHEYLNCFKLCALTDMSLNYTGSGTYMTYEKGQPVHTTMNLTFKELFPVYAEEYEEGLGEKGLGY